MTKQFGDINNLLKSYDGEKFAQLIKDNETLVGQVKSLGELSLIHIFVIIRTEIYIIVEPLVYCLFDTPLFFCDDEKNDCNWQ